MKTIGTKLRKQRERRKLSLAEVAASTKIQERYLAAIESGEHAELPATVFVRGYLRTYAESLGLDAASVLEDYDREHEAPADQPSDRAILEQLAARQRPASTRPAPTLRTAAIIAVVVLLVGVGAWALLNAWRAGNRVDAPQPLAPSPKADAASSPPPPIPEPPREAEVLVEAVAPPPPPPESAPPPRSAAAGAVAESRLEVPEFGVGTEVVDRKLVGVADRFEPGSTVVFWTRVVGGQPGDVVRHVWLHEGRAIAAAELAIGGSHWRTYSRRVLEAGSRGEWVVEARDVSGRLLARSSFICE